MKNNLTQLKTIAKVLSVDKIITNEEMESLLESIMTLLLNFKTEAEGISEESKKYVDDTVTQINRYFENTLTEVDNKNVAITEEIISKINEIKALRAEIEAISRIIPIDGIDGKDGKDADEEAMMKELNATIPKKIEEMVTGESVVDMINALGDNDVFRIDARHIKNLPEVTKARTGGIGGVRLLSLLNDVNVDATTTTNGMVLAYNTATKMWEASTASTGGTPGGSTTEVQFNDGGSFAGDSTFTFNKTTKALNATSITLSSLSSGRVPFVGASGLLTDSSEFLWSTSTKTMYLQGTNTSSSGNQAFLAILTTLNQTGTAGYKALQVNLTETAVGSGLNYLASFEVGGAIKSYITNKGVMGFTHGIEIGFNPGGASAAQNAIRNVGGISFTASTGGYGADNFHSDGTNMYYDLGNGMMFFRPQGGATYAIYLNNNSTGFEYKGSAGTTVFSISGTGNTYVAGNIELGAATDTTISRVSAGVIAVEGVTVPTISSTNTLTNKFVTPQVQSVADAGGTLTPVAITNDVVIATALSQATTIAAPTGSPVQGEKLVIRLKDNGTARALTWNAIYRAVGVTLPTTTVLGKIVYCGFIYNSTDTKWDCVAVAQEA